MTREQLEGQRTLMHEHGVPCVKGHTQVRTGSLQRRLFHPIIRIHPGRVRTENSWIELGDPGTCRTRRTVDYEARSSRMP